MMDEALNKSGEWPNVAIEAGSDPKEVMRKYGVTKMGMRTASQDYGQRIKALEQLARDMYEVASIGEFDVGEEMLFHERMKALGIEVDE